MRGLIALLACLLWACSFRGDRERPRAVVGERERFAFFSGAYFGSGTRLGRQLLLEHADGFLLRSLSASVGPYARGRLVGNREVLQRYGRNFLPIPYSEVPAACGPRTAALVLDRVEVDVFVVFWSGGWPASRKGPRLDDDFGGEDARPSFLGMPFHAVAYAAKDCRPLGVWRVRSRPEWTSAGAWEDEQSLVFAGKVADAFVERLGEPLGLAPAISPRRWLRRR
jgi:hypothetical protein